MRLTLITMLILTSVPLLMLRADEADVKTLVKKSLDAVGGEDKLLRLFRIKERLVLGPDPQKPGIERNSILQPPTAWWVGKKERVKDEMEPAIFLVWAWTLAPLTDPKSKIEVLPDIQENDQPAYGLRVSETVTPPLEMYFDKTTARLVVINWRKDTHRFSEWKEHDGVHYAAKTVGYKPNGKPWYSTEVIELERLKELPAGLRTSAKNINQ